MEYISIKDFASRAGVSPQAIYQRLDKDLQGYVKVIKGKKTLDIKALDLFVDKHVGQAVDKSFQDILTVLSNQLLEKDKQIAEKDRQIAEQQQTAKDLTAANRELTATIENMTVNLQAAQALHAGSLQTQNPPQLAAATPDEKPRRWWPFGRKKDGQQ